MVELAGVVVEAEQKRADELAAARIAEAADDAIGAAQMFQFQHRALAWQITRIEPLGDDAVERATGMLAPRFGALAIARVFRQPQRRGQTYAGVEFLERLTAFDQRLLENDACFFGVEAIEEDEDRRRL